MQIAIIAVELFLFLTYIITIMKAYNMMNNKDSWESFSFYLGLGTFVLMFTLPLIL